MLLYKGKLYPQGFSYLLCDSEGSIIPALAGNDMHFLLICADCVEPLQK
jgi:hypothetical protein